MKEKSELIKELQDIHADLFILKSKASLKWLEEDIERLMVKISAVIETLGEMEIEEGEKKRRRNENNKT